MIAIFLIACFVISAAWFAWLYGVTPKSDEVRIRDDQDGTGARIVSIRRVGTKRERLPMSWMASGVAPRRWMRVYEVRIDRPDGFAETYEVGVEARLFGYQGLTRFDLRAGA